MYYGDYRIYNSQPKEDTGGLVGKIYYRVGTLDKFKVVDTDAMTDWLTLSKLEDKNEKIRVSYFTLLKDYKEIWF